MSSFLSASSSVSRNSQIIPGYIFQSGSLSSGLGVDEAGMSNDSVIQRLGSSPSQSSNLGSLGQVSPGEGPRTGQTVEYKRYTPVHLTTGAPIYRSLSMGSEEYKDRLKASNSLQSRRDQQFARTEGRAPEMVEPRSGSSCFLGKCELPGAIGDLYRVESVSRRGGSGVQTGVTAFGREKVLNSISRNIINDRSPRDSSGREKGTPNRPLSPRGEALKSMFSIKPSEKKQVGNQMKQNALIQEFKKSPRGQARRPLLPEDISPIACMNNACSNIKGAIEVLGVTGRIFLDVLVQLASAFDLDGMEASSKNKEFGVKFGNLPHFPVSSIDMPPDTVILQCFDCGLIYYTNLPLNKQQLGTVGILEPKPVEFGVKDSEEVIHGVADRSSPYYCWGNLEPRDLTPNQIEFLRKVDLRKQAQFSHQDLVDLYYYRFRRDRRFDENFPSYLQSDPQLHLYKFYRETMHGAYNGHKTPLPDLGTHFVPSPWSGNRSQRKSPSRPSSPSSSEDGEAEGKSFEKDEFGFIILPKFDLPSENQDGSIVFKPDTTHHFPFVLDKL
ncbi:cytohesin-like protein [Cryptosporidium felis]|nr:cytohesin-like protein [Cryptosporidium felis]